MTSKGRFHIPSSTEMDQDSASASGIQSLFKSHQAIVKSNIKNKTPAEDSFISNPAPVQASTTAFPGTGITSSSITSQDGNSASTVPQHVPQVTVKPTNINVMVQSSNLNPTTSNKTESISSVSGSTSAGQPSGTKQGELPGTPPRPGSKTHSLVVSARQRGNPVLKFIRNIPWEYGDIVPDYVMGQSSCALFLSLRYHQLNNNYIHERLKKLGHSYSLRVLLVQVDIKEPHHCLKELAKICLLSDCTLILAWSPEEAGRYLETYKSFENKPPDLIMEKIESNYMARVTDFITCAKKVNKTDAVTLLSTFGTVDEIIGASEEDLSLCPGFGPQKAKRLHSIFHEPFLKSKKQREGTSQRESTSSESPKKTTN